MKIYEKTGNVGGVWQSNYAGYTLQAGGQRLGFCPRRPAARRGKLHGNCTLRAVNPFHPLH